MLQFALADQAEIKIDTADFSLVHPGNDVSVKVLVMPQPTGMAQAVEVKVQLPEPPGVQKKSPEGKRDG